MTTWTSVWWEYSKDFGILNSQRIVDSKDVAGKLVRVRGLIITAPHNILVER